MKHLGIHSFLILVYVDWVKLKKEINFRMRRKEKKKGQVLWNFLLYAKGLLLKQRIDRFQIRGYF